MQHTTTEIMGGLGNQLFQIFTLLAYCLRHKLPFYFSTVPIQHGKRKQTYWHTAMLQSLQPFVKYPPSSIPPTLLHEEGFHYQPIPFYEQEQVKPMQVKPMHMKPMHMKLFGYFQSYKYFQDQEAQIYKLIKLQQTQDLIKSKTPYNYTNMIAVHFRVGDYINLQQCHPLMPINYYIKALSQFLQDQSPALCETLEQAKHNDTIWQILYFCEKNDQTYVETQFIQQLQAHPPFQGKFHFQCIDHSLADWEQVIVMSLCQHKIIANSTFSWWGAYLGAGRQVYYPSTWFGPAMGNKNMNDLFPPNWQKINC